MVALSKAPDRFPPAATTQLRRWRTRAAAFTAQYTAAKAQCEACRQRGAACTAKLVQLREAQRVAQAVAQATQTQAYKQLAEVVTSCLSIFEPPYTFRIDFERKRGKTEAYLRFARDGVTCHPINAAGGGVVDVAAFALRLAALTLTRPKLRPLLVLDEAFKYVSAEYRPRVRTLLHKLATTLGVQILLVTHSPQLQIGKVTTLE